MLTRSCVVATLGRTLQKQAKYQRRLLAVAQFQPMFGAHKMQTKLVGASVEVRRRLYSSRVDPSAARQALLNKLSSKLDSTYHGRLNSLSVRVRVFESVTLA